MSQEEKAAQSAEEQEKVLKQLNPNKVIIPVVLSVAAVIAYIFFSDQEMDLGKMMSVLSSPNLIWFALAFVVLFVRDFGYVFRIKNISNNELSWKASIYVVLLWEFASALTPSIVGGTAVAIFIMNREGIPMGKSMAYVMLTAVLDNLFFVFAALFVSLFASARLFEIGSMSHLAGTVQGVFYTSVAVISGTTLFMTLGLFIAPNAFKWLLSKIFSIPFLSRWKEGAEKSGDDMVIASREIRGMSFMYWVKAIFSTLFIWSARYFMLNCLMAAYTGMNVWDHLMVFSRQIVMWITMLVSPTPGSAGVAESIFPAFFDEFFVASGISFGVALVWRLFTYYAYLLAGVIVLPRWLKRVLS